MNIEIRNDIREKLTEYIQSIGLHVESMGYNKQSGVIKLVFTNPPTEQQMIQIRVQIPVLEKMISLEGVELYDSILSNVTPDMIDNYIDNNVVNLPSVKQYLKRLSKAVLFLYDKLEE